MTHKFGINGFGRIGRTAFRVWWQHHRDSADLTIINTSGSMELSDWVHLIKYDSNYGPFLKPIQVDQQRLVSDISDDQPILGTITIGSHLITVTAQRDPVKVPWGQFGIETVVEATGAFTTEDKAKTHLHDGVKRVLLSAPPKGGTVGTGIIGINHLDPNQPVVSNESCTTNCVAPIAAVITGALGVKKAMMTTIHAYTDDQNLHDNSHKDLRRARAAAQNIVPTSTGASIATTRVVPELAGLFDGLSIRVPNRTGSLADMVFLVNRTTSIAEVNQILIDAANEPQWAGILTTTTDPIVSSDIIGRPESSIVDLSLTNVVDGDLVKIVSWYDNEWGYCNRLIEQVVALSSA